MPEYDGSIIIDSKIDTSGFDKTADELFKKSDSLANKLSQSIGKISQAKMQPINMQLTDNISPKLPKIQQDIAVLSKYVDNIKIKQEELKQTISSGGIGKNITFEKFVEQTKVLASEYERTLKRIEKLQLKQSLMPQVQVSDISTPISPNTNNSSRSISDVVRNINSSSKELKGAKLETTSLESAMNSLGKSMTKVFTVAKFIILRQAIRALVKEVIAGFEDLGKFSPDFGNTLQSIKDSFKNFVNAVVTAFAPLITALAPIINRILSMLTALATNVAYLTTALFSNSNKVSIANTNFSNYGKTIDKTNKKAKALKDTLAKFDKLDVLKQKGSEGIGGSSKIEPAFNMFKEVELPDWAKDFRSEIDKIKEHVKDWLKENSKDYDSWGEHVSEKSKIMTDNLKTNWDNMWSNLGTNTFTLWDDFAANMQKTWNNLKTNWDNLCNNLNKNWNDIFPQFQEDTAELSKSINNLWQDIKKGDFSKLEEDLDAIGKKWDKLIDNLKKSWNKMWEDLGKDWNKMWENWNRDWDNAWSDFKRDLDNIWSDFKRDWIKMWEDLGRDIAEIIKEIFRGLIKTALQQLLPGMSEILKVYDKIEKYKSGKISFDELKVSARVPALATGTVVSPNSRFLAMLGDNTSEQEIVSPLSTIEQAVANVLGSGNYGTNQGDVVLQMDGQTFARLMNPYNKSENNRVGVSMVRGIY